MEKFFETFGTQLKTAVIEDYNSLLSLIGNEKSYACALVTDSDAMTLFFAMNTIEKYNEKLVKAGDKYKAYYKWTPGEWAYGDHLSGKKMISKVSDVLSEKRDTVKDNVSDFEIHLFETMTSTLKEVISDGYFSDMTVFISISDDKRTRDVENYSAKMLNQPDVYNDFLNRFG